MARLSERIKYFVNKKVTEDSNWRVCRVILSGHDVPGEGEHKIMEYIRKSRAQPDYNPNVRHCLYGLDADLIVLGLLSPSRKSVESHEPTSVLVDSIESPWFQAVLVDLIAILTSSLQTISTYLVVSRALSG
jgi:hypothetical protein